MSVSDDLKTDAWSPDGDLPLVLLELDHDDLDSPILVVNNTENVESGGVTYIAFPFEISLPSDGEDSPPAARLKIDNVSREIGQAIRKAGSAVSVTIRVVRMDDPDTVEVKYPGFLLRNVEYDALTVEGDLELENLIREPYPAITFSPAEFPGLVR